MLGTIYKCEICLTESSSPSHWFVIHCSDARLQVCKCGTMYFTQVTNFWTMYRFVPACSDELAAGGSLTICQEFLIANPLRMEFGVYCLGDHDHPRRDSPAPQQDLKTTDNSC